MNGLSSEIAADELTARSVYVHVPFCRHRCGYCNFTVAAGRDHLADDYLRAIEIELSALGRCQPVDTIYLGGGTPSRLSRDHLSRLLDLLTAKFELDTHGEFTIEANPDDLPGEIGQVIQSSWINRISLGIQSFDQAKLRSLDRDHSSQQIEDALVSCGEIVDRFSVDLIFAAPHDSSELWNADLRQAVACGAGHVSTYELTFEKGTAFWNQRLHGKLAAENDDACAEYYQATIDELTANGFEHYEISSFAKPGHRSRHNQAYWTGESYLAFGPGAAGLVAGTRYTHDRSVGRYLKKVLSGESPIEESQVIGPGELAVERLVFGLRLVEGVDVPNLETSSGFGLFELVPKDVLERLTELGFIKADYENRLKLTSRGLLAGDYVCSQVLGGG